MTQPFTNYHYTGEYFTQPAEDIVELTLNAPVYGEEDDSSEEGLSPSEEETYKETVQNIESYIRKNPPRGWDLQGPLNPLMPKSVMQQVLSDTVAHMKKRGQCITQSEYKKMQEEGKKFHKTDGQLSRIWGSNFINEQLTDHPNYKAAKHYLVIPDTLESIDFRVTIDPFNNCFPRVNTVGNQAIQVVSEYIEGSCFGHKSPGTPIANTGFKDFAPANVLEQKETGIKYAVDTEVKSFDQIGSRYPNHKNLRRELSKFRGSEFKGKQNQHKHLTEIDFYLVTRWEALSKCPLEDQTITVKI